MVCGTRRSAAATYATYRKSATPWTARIDATNRVRRGVSGCATTKPASVVSDVAHQLLGRDRDQRKVLPVNPLGEAPASFDRGGRRSDVRHLDAREDRVRTKLALWGSGRMRHQPRLPAIGGESRTSDRGVAQGSIAAAKVVVTTALAAASPAARGGRSRSSYPWMVCASTEGEPTEGCG